MATTPLSITDFAAKVKAKYPDYADVDDTELTNRIITKHPEYKDQVNLEATTPPPVPWYKQIYQGTTDLLKQQLPAGIGAEVGRMATAGGGPLAVAAGGGLGAGVGGALGRTFGGYQYNPNDPWYKQLWESLKMTGQDVLGGITQVAPAVGQEAKSAALIGQESLLHGGVPVASDIKTPLRTTMRLGEQAKKIAPTGTTTKLGAGQAIQQDILDTLAERKDTANKSYDKFREIVNRPANASEITEPIEVQGYPQSTTGTASGVFPAATKPFSAAFDYAPLHNELSKVWPDLQGYIGTHPELKPLEDILSQPSSVDLATAERDLGELKRVMRGINDARDIPGRIKTRTQGIAAMITNKLQPQIEATVKNLPEGGEEALKALRTGRTAVAQQHNIERQFLKWTQQEPVAVVNKLVKSEDSGYRALSQVQKHFPEQIPNVTRSVLEGMVKSGNFDAWSKLGDATKLLLTQGNQEHVAALNSIFTNAAQGGMTPMQLLSRAVGLIMRQHVPLITGVTATVRMKSLIAALNSPEDANALVQLAKGGTKVPARIMSALAIPAAPAITNIARPEPTE